MPRIQHRHSLASAKGRAFGSCSSSSSLRAPFHPRRPLLPDFPSSRRHLAFQKPAKFKCRIDRTLAVPLFWSRHPRCARLFSFLSECGGPRVPGRGSPVRLGRSGTRRSCTRVPSSRGVSVPVRLTTSPLQPSFSHLSKTSLRLSPLGSPADSHGVCVLFRPGHVGPYGLPRVRLVAGREGGGGGRTRVPYPAVFRPARPSSS